YHEGSHFKVRGPSPTPSTRQGKPLPIQAGASPQGIASAAKNTVAVYPLDGNLMEATGFRTCLDKQIKQGININSHIKVFPGLVTYVGRTRKEALAKKAALDEKLPLETALKQLSFFIQQDCSNWNVDKKVPPLPPIEEFAGPVGRYETILEIIADTE